MKLKAVQPASGDSKVFQLLIRHPNFNGMQMDQALRTYTPARFIQEVRVSAGDTLVFDLETDISLSEDPALTFGLAPGHQAPLTVEVNDSAGAHFRQQFDLETAASH